MNKSGGVLEEVLETGGSKAKQAGKTVAGAVSDAAKAAGSQINGRSKGTQDIVESLYAKSDQDLDKNPNQNPQSSKDNTPEDLEKKKKLQELRQQLHNEVYYDPLVNLKKPQLEEKPAEKVEREKREEMVDFQKKKKKQPPPLVVKTQQRVERLPGSG